MSNNLNAEKTLLGCILLNNKSLHDVNTIIDEKSFHYELHQMLFSSITKIINEGEQANSISLYESFCKLYCLDQVENDLNISVEKYIKKIINSSDTEINAKSLANIVYEKHVARTLVEQAQGIITNVQGNKQSIAELISDAEKKIFEINDKSKQSTNICKLSEGLQESLQSIEKAIKEKGQIQGITSGFRDLDEITGGLQDSDLIILAGRPAMGKTSLALNIAINASKAMQYREKKHVLFFSLEMPSQQLCNRILSMETGVNIKKMRSGLTNEYEFSDILAGVKQLSKLNLHIDQSSSITINSLVSKAKKLDRRYPVGLILVDYLQLLKASSYSGNRVLEVSEITQGLKALAKELNVPVIALSQLSRTVEKREPPIPHLSDLRDSGSIEQDADIVMFVYREEYYLKNTEVDPNNSEEYIKWQDKLMEVKDKASLIIAKHRNGEVGKVQLKFTCETTKFEDIEIIEFADDED